MRSRQRRATRSFPDLSRLRWPLPPLAPARAAAVSAAVVLEVAAPTAATAAHAPVCLWSFSTYAGEMSSVLFLYRASPRFRGPGAARSPHPPHLHRAPPLPTSGQSSAVLRAEPRLAEPGGCQSAGPVESLCAYMCVYLYI